MNYTDAEKSLAAKTPYTVEQVHQVFEAVGNEREATLFVQACASVGAPCHYPSAQELEEYTARRIENAPAPKGIVWTDK